ncbi:biofilm regulation phosphoprotein SiaC [Crenobacter sp. SG2305]|uniref:biofilm regulation phosphoprotein SiaC n=1 Tax=Crenobacter oryzisoli TaxID=3056844 RepID=UPI0025AB40B0|nr:biofilm regulation phosphoprotein SiaC [Crenobacter sp. SG2305]MDN0085689.1 biofilm regulation phosphoprotein SiaC [Crenobacter sp. SG2305]
MQDLNVAGTDSIPSIQASWASGRLEMKGDSYPENAFELYQPVIDWIEVFLKTENRPLLMQLQLLYLNTSSIRAMMDMLDLLEDAHKQGKPVGVTWLYERDNERVAELAEEFREDYTLRFDIVPQE